MGENSQSSKAGTSSSRAPGAQENERSLVNTPALRPKFMANTNTPVLHVEYVSQEGEVEKLNTLNIEINKNAPFTSGGQATIYQVNGEPGLLLKVFKRAPGEEKAALEAAAYQEFYVTQGDPYLQAQAYMILPDGSPAYLMRKIVGPTLTHVLHADGAENPRSKKKSYLLFNTRLKLWVDQLQTYGTQVFSRDLRHLDLTPHNIIVERDYSPKIIDFGFAQFGHQKTTRYNGTPGYAAPEQFVGDSNINTSPKSDVWALGQLGFDIFKAEPRDVILKDVTKDEKNTNVNATKRIYHHHSASVFRRQKATLFSGIPESLNEFLIEKTLIKELIFSTQYWNPKDRIEPEQLILASQFILELHNSVNAVKDNSKDAHVQKIQEYFLEEPDLLEASKALTKIILENAEYYYLIKYTHTLISFLLAENMPEVFAAIEHAIILDYYNTLKQVPGLPLEVINKFCCQLLTAFDLADDPENILNINVNPADDRAYQNPAHEQPEENEKGSWSSHREIASKRKTPIDNIETFFLNTIKKINYQENISPSSHGVLLEDIQSLKRYVLFEYDKLATSIDSDNIQVRAYAISRRAELEECARNTYNTTALVFNKTSSAAEKQEAISDYKSTMLRIYHTDQKILRIIGRIVWTLVGAVAGAVFGGAVGHAPGIVVGAVLGGAAGATSSSSFFFANPVAKVAASLEVICKEDAEKSKVDSASRAQLVTT